MKTTVGQLKKIINEEIKKTPKWGDNPWKRNDPERCSGQVRTKAGRMRLKGRCILKSNHEGICKLSHEVEE